VRDALGASGKRRPRDCMNCVANKAGGGGSKNDVMANVEDEGFNNLYKSNG